jgi:hypothetical protein
MFFLVLNDVSETKFITNSPASLKRKSNLILRDNLQLFVCFSITLEQAGHSDGDEQRKQS